MDSNEDIRRKRDRHDAAVRAMIDAIPSNWERNVIAVQKMKQHMHVELVEPDEQAA